MLQPETTSRRTMMQQFVEAAGWRGATLLPLAGDASFRRYERVFLHQNGEEQRAVLMDAPPEKEDTAPFIAVGRYLQAQGLSAPRILAEDRENGFLLLEDLGDDSYTRLLADCPAVDLPKLEKQLYHEAVAVLAELHQRNRHAGIELAIPAYSHQELMRELALFAEWYLPAVMGDNDATRQRAAEFIALWDEVLRAHPFTSDIVVLRDYHADNLLWLPQREGIQRVGLLDFQDALIGNAAYDLVSLLEDARRDVLSDTVESALSHYITLSGANREQLMQDYAILGAQRQAKIIGIFVRLGVRDGKTHYTRYLPRVWAHFMHDLQHPLLGELRQWVTTHISPGWRGEITLTPATLPA